MSVQRSAVRLALVLVLMALGLLGATRASAEQQEGVCYDPVGTFDPFGLDGGCVSYKLGEDAMVVLGRALVEDGYAPAGTVVRALVNDQVCGQVWAGSDFELHVLGAGEIAGCAAPGDTVRFEIGDVEAAETLTWPAAPEPVPLHSLSLTSIRDHAWYWFERVSNPRPRVGTTVQAFVGETLCGEAAVGGEDEAKGYFIPEGIRGFSRLIVPSASVQAGCAQNSSLAEFRVGGLRAETALLWRPGVQRLNLQVQGDANCDFLVDPRDATLVLQKYAGLVESVPCHGDADRDGDIDVFDARHILEFAAGIFSALPL